MNQLAKRLAADFEALTADGEPLVTIATRHRAQSIIAVEGSFTTIYDGPTREPDQASAVIVTAPVPQALELFDQGGLVIDPSIDEGIRALRYHPVVGLLTLVDRAPDLGPAGALQRPDDPDFTFVADNAAKSVSPVPAVTFHASHALSASLFDQSDDDIADVLVPKAKELLGEATITAFQVKKWRYAGPVTPWPDRAAVVATNPGPVVMAGDAFGGPKVEGAYLSGRAAAAAILERS